MKGMGEASPGLLRRRTNLKIMKKKERRRIKLIICLTKEGETRSSQSGMKAIFGIDISVSLNVVSRHLGNGCAVGSLDYVIWMHC